MIYLRGSWSLRQKRHIDNFFDEFEELDRAFVVIEYVL